MHVGLILLSPVLNIAVSVSDRKTLLLLVGSLLTATALPSVTDLSLLPTWWEGCYPLTYYLLGAAIARLQPRVRPVPCLAAAAATAVFLWLFSRLFLDKLERIRVKYGLIPSAS